MNQAHDNEIDLFELFEILWSGKWLIAGFTALSLLIGSGFLALKAAEYESKIFIKIDNLPPFYDVEKVLFF
jgi:LPS O-antigen subunit length determinant protein (WzzB/FepE family)